MTSVILSGGRNSRFPHIKGFVEVNGTSIIETNIELLKGLTGNVVISTNAPERYFRLGLPLIGDVTESLGPMSGIFSALYCTGDEEVLAVASDMPFINPDLVRLVMDMRAGDATVPVFGGRPEPLPAVYSRSLLGTMEALIKENRTSLTRMLNKVDTHYIDEDDVSKTDPGGRSFININTPEDYSRHINA
jgi:molybdopterin-guanine dinucleotide biosynthesis protein A